MTTSTITSKWKIFLKRTKSFNHLDELLLDSKEEWSLTISDSFVEKFKENDQEFDVVDSILEFQDDYIKRLVSTKIIDNAFVIPDFGLKLFKEKNMFTLVNSGTIVFSGFNEYIQVDVIKVRKKMLIACAKPIALFHLKERIVCVEEKYFRQVCGHEAKTCTIND
jgi:hypothetical protein